VRDRHLPRVCRSCDAPMAGQDDTCWKCNATWDDQLGPRNPVRTIPDPAAELPEAEHEADRSTDEGDRLAAAAPERTTAPSMA
jgi:hypothetical protein